VRSVQGSAAEHGRDRDDDRAIRQIERCGTSSLLERAFKGFSALPEFAASAGAAK
jgi:hypothetical protein